VTLARYALVSDVGDTADTKPSLQRGQCHCGGQSQPRFTVLLNKEKWQLRDVSCSLVSGRQQTQRLREIVDRSLGVLILQCALRKLAQLHRSHEVLRLQSHSATLSTYQPT